MSNPEENHAQQEFEDESDEEESNPLAHLPKYVIKRVDRLKELDKSRDDIMAMYKEERAALEKKYQTQLVPLYQERAHVVDGDHDDSIDNGEEHPVDGARVKGIPQFWACAMTHMETVGELIAEEDIDCLEYLQDIQCDDNDQGTGFKLSFFFKENPYFANEVLTKAYEVPNLLVSDEPLIKKVDGCKIDWKPEKCLTHRTIQKKQRGKGKNAGQVRTILKQEEKESFFNWFTPPELPALDTSMDDIDEEEVERVEELFENDYEVAQAFRSDIIPKAVSWFTGKAVEEEMEGALLGGMLNVAQPDT